MSLITIVGWILCGLLVGLLARFLVPGQQNMGIILTAVLGIVGAMVGGFLFSLVAGSPESATANWYGWIVSILGAMLVLWVWTILPSRRSV